MKRGEIHRTCEKYNIENYTINSDNSIDVDGSVILDGNNLTKIPLNFNKVNRDFSCFNNILISLEGSPNEVGGNFNCNCNKLTSSKGASLEIGGDFYCFDNPVKLDYNKYLKGVKRVNKLKRL